MKVQGVDVGKVAHAGAKGPRRDLRTRREAARHRTRSGRGCDGADSAPHGFVRPLLELPDIRVVVTEFDPASLTWPWRHRDPRVDALQQQVMRLVGTNPLAPRARMFEAICDLSEGTESRDASTHASAHRAIPVLSENWYCCAEPSPEDVRLV